MYKELGIPLASSENKESLRLLPFSFIHGELDAKNQTDYIMVKDQGDVEAFESIAKNHPGIYKEKFTNDDGSVNDVLVYVWFNSTTRALVVLPDDPQANKEAYDKFRNKLAFI